jgi:hypothetical protein
MKILRSLAVASLVVLALTSASAPARPGATPPRPAPPAGTTAKAAPAKGSALQAALPDTTLARVFFARGRADVTLSQMRRAATKLGARPDSLTPQELRQVLELLIQQAILTHRVHQDPRHWNASDSSDYLVLRDRLTLTAAIDSALVEHAYRMAARGDTVPGREALGILVRDSTLAALHPVYDNDMFNKLVAGFAALPKPDMDMPLRKRIEMTAALPTVSREDSAKTLLACSADSVTVGRLLTDLGRLTATRRPEIRGTDDLRDFCKSKVFEVLLRRAARDQDLEHRPRIARQLSERSEFLDVQRFVSTEIYDKVPVDSTTLRRHFVSAADRFLTSARAVVVQTVLDKREAADSLARRLTVPGFAESLVVQSSRAGVPYRFVLDERSDSTLYRRMSNGGVGAVVGPDPLRDGWRVLKVMELQPRQPQSFEAAYPEVRNDWLANESERRMRELMSKLLASSIVNVNKTSPYLDGRKRIPR